MANLFPNISTWVHNSLDAFFVSIGLTADAAGVLVFLIWGIVVITITLIGAPVVMMYITWI